MKLIKRMQDRKSRIESVMKADPNLFLQQIRENTNSDNLVTIRNVANLYGGVPDRVMIKKLKNVMIWKQEQSYVKYEEV